MATSQRLPRPFKLERFFAQHEFSARHLLCCSDCEPLLLKQLLEVADDDSLARFDQLRLSYTESQGLPALRQAIAGLYDSVAPEQLVACVPEEGIYLTMRALLAPGDRVVCMFPAYQSLHELAAAAGCELALWEPTLRSSSSSSSGPPPAAAAPAPATAAAAAPAAADDAWLEFDVAHAEALIRAAPTRLVVINFPHNPTGAMLAAADWQRLVAACRAAGAWLLSDEMYRFTELDPADRMPSGVDCYEKAVTLCGLSKSWGLPGLRLGWLACKNAELLQKLLALKDYTTICSPAPSEVLALAAVRATPQLTQRCRDIISANLALAEAFFSGRWPAVFGWRAPRGSPVAFPRLRADPGPGGIEAWCARLVAEAGVLLLPASVYDHAPSTERRHFRLGLGRDDFANALQALDGWLVKEYGEPVI